jgi:tRNA (cytidine/uridine-2'-O-)-methyltransferase
MIAHPPTMRIALYQPDIPQNTGSILRLAACFGVPVDIIEPTGLIWNDPRLKRAGMDYRDLADVTRHRSWTAFLAQARAGRLILLTSSAEQPHHLFRFQPDDILLFGRESAGAPPEVHAASEVRLRIPMRPPARSLNLAVAVALVVGEALRQCDGFSEGFP